MATLTTDWFKNNYANISFSTPKKINVAFYTRTPTLGSDQAASFASVTSITSLDSRPEWVKVTSTVTSSTTTSAVNQNLFLRSLTISGSDNLFLQLVYNSTGSTYVAANVDDGIGWKFGPAACQDVATVAVFYIDDGVTYSGVSQPVILATDQGIGTGTVVHANSLFGQLAATNNYLIAVERYYNGSAIPANLIRSNPVAGYCLLLPSSPKWQSAHAHHLWLEPQRTNFAANPSFSNYTTVSAVNYPTHWRSNATLTESSGAGSVSATVGTVIESNFFPVVGEWLSISFLVKVSVATTFTFGAVLFDDTHTKPTFLAAGTTTVASSQTFTQVQGLLKIPGGVSQMCFRLQVTEGSSTLLLDDVLLDPHESQYEYFDGSSTRGLPGDFRWMGGTSYANKHFSVWYNNYVNTKNRLMGDYDEDDDRYKSGLVEDWAPQGSNIIAHWDAVTPYAPTNWVGDAFYPISDVAGSTVTNVS